MTPAGTNYGRVYRQSWGRGTFKAASDDGKLAAVYLLTNAHGNTEGLYRLPLIYVAYDLGWDVDRVAAAFDELERLGFIEYDAAADLVLVSNALRFQPPVGDKSIKGAVNSVAGTPPSRLRWRFVELADTHCLELGKALRTTLQWTKEAPSEPAGRSFDGPSGQSGSPIEASAHLSSFSNSSPPLGAAPAGSAKKGTRISEDWTPNAELFHWARENHPQVNLSEETEKFRNHWLSKTGKDATKLRWDLTWKNWISNSKNFTRSAQQSQTRQQRSQQSLEYWESLMEREDAEMGPMELGEGAA